MNIFEYQGKSFFKQYGIRVPDGIVLDSSQDVPCFERAVVVKAQVLTGGRGKADAIRKCGNHAEVKAAVKDILEMTIKGHEVGKVLIEDAYDIEKEYYFSIFINRSKKTFSLMFTDQGGIDIESIDRGRISQVDVNPVIGMRNYMIKKLLSAYGLENDEELRDIISKAFKLFTDKKLQLLEINPLARTAEGHILALDAKVVLDDWYIDEAVKLSGSEAGGLTEFERDMAKYDVTAVEMGGDIVVLGAGAGVSMATADSLVQRGGTIRAVIDLGTLPSDSADPDLSEYAAGALKLLLKLNPKVILLNYYYQAGRLDYEAMTVSRAFGEVSKTLPIIVRCKGRMAAEGIALLNETDIYVTDSYQDACECAIKRLEALN